MNLLLHRHRDPDGGGELGNDDPTAELGIPVEGASRQAPYPGRPAGGDRSFSGDEAPSPELEAAAVFDVTRPVSVRMHPRFAVRWTQVRREAGRRRLRVVVVTGSVVAVLLAGFGSLYTPMFGVDRVTVTGAGPIPRADVLAAAGLGDHPLMIDVDAARADARLDAVPQLADASVARQWPSTIRVRVRYRTPVAVVGSANGWTTVDGTGRVLSLSPSVPQGLPVIHGGAPAPSVGQWLSGAPGPRAALPGSGGPGAVDLNAAVDSPSAPVGIAAALAAAAALPASLRGDVQSITFGPGAASFAGAAGGTLSMTVLPATMASGSITVDLGDGSQLATKLTALVTLLTEANLAGATGIDISVPNRPAVLTAR